MKRLLSVHVIVLLVIASVMVTPVQASTTTVKGGTTIGTAKALPWSTGKYFVTKMSASRKHYWFKFKTCSDYRFYTITVKNCNKPGYADYYLTDSASSSLSKGSLWNGDSRNFDIKLKGSRYYYLHLVNYSGNSSGNIKFDIKSRRDIVGDTISSAKAISIGKTYAGTLDGSKDVDYVKVKPASSGTYKFVVKNCNYSGNMVFKVMDRYEDTFSSKTCYKGDGGTMSVKLTKGQWYYVRLNGFGRVGTYKVTVKK